MTRSPDFQNERGERQIRRILAALVDGPLTAIQIAERLHLTRAGVHLYLRRLQDAPRRVRVADYLRNGGRPFSMYALGSEQDAPFVQARKLRRKKAKERPGPEVQCQQLLDALTGNPQTVRDLADSLNVSLTYIRTYLNILRAGRQVYVSRWQHPDGRGPLSPVYAVGKNRCDKQRPACDRKTYEQRIKSDPAKAAERLARRRIQEMLREAGSKPQTPFSALFTGMPA